MAKKKARKTARQKAAQRSRGKPKVGHRVTLGRVEPEYLLSLLDPSQWNLLASAFDGASISTQAAENAARVKGVLLDFFGSEQFKLAFKAEPRVSPQSAPHAIRETDQNEDGA